MAIVRRLLEQDPARRDEIALLGWTIAEQTPGRRLSASSSSRPTPRSRSRDWASAAAALQEFVTRVPNHIPALMRLVEICVDGGLEATMYSAQAQLADAYIAAGAATEARFIAEDLVAREPWETANIERFRRALVLLGEPDPDALIAERLSGESPFMSTDLLRRATFADAGTEPPPVSERAAGRGAVAEPAGVRGRGRGADAPAEDGAQAERGASRRGASFRAERERHRSRQHPRRLRARAAARRRARGVRDVEVDLSIVLDDIKQPGAGAAAPPAPRAVRAISTASSAACASEASRRSGLDDAEKEYKRGLALRKAGDIDGCIAALEKASRAPKLRFATSWLIARLYRDRDMMPQAVEWFERAAQAPAPNADDGHQLLYELADALEADRRDRARAGDLPRAAGRRGRLPRRRRAHRSADQGPGRRVGPDSAASSTSPSSSRSACCSSSCRGPAFWEHNYFAVAWPPLRTVPDQQLRARRGQRPRRREPVRRASPISRWLFCRARAARDDVASATARGRDVMTLPRHRSPPARAADAPFDAARRVPRRAGAMRRRRRRRSHSGARARSRGGGAGDARRATSSRVTRGTATRVVVNDRLDVALACGADGVHLRGDSIPVAAARRIAPPGS